MISRSLVFVLIFFASLHLYAQPLVVETRLKGIFDNREYTREYNNDKESIAGSQLTFEIGPKVNNEHTLRAGLNYFYEFGSEFLEIKPTPILYYSFLNSDIHFVFGAYLRSELPKFPLAMLSEKFTYYYPTVDGVLIQREGKNYQLTAFADWVSRQNEFRREQFMVAFAGSLRPNNLIGEMYLYQFHNGGRTVTSPTDYIDDYLGGIAMAGYNFSSLLGVDKAEIKTGIFTSTHRDRMTSKTHTINHSSYSEIAFETHRIGAEVMLKFGQKHQVAFGDQFYTTVNNYIRTNLYFVPIKSKQVEARFTWSLHTYNGILDHQQLFQLMYFIK